jgi:precorrin-2/cobalt-factor-2 C20-methyltransferase
MKKLYGIGTGPGAADLLTIRAARTIENSDIVFAPYNKGINMALDTAKEYIKDKKIVLLDFPMGRVQREDYKKAAEIILKEIPEDGCGCFLTIGDPMIYSTFIYLMEELEDKEIEMEVVSGIPSFIAASAESKSPLTKKGDSFLLCDELDENILDLVDSVAILKTSKNKEKLIDDFEDNNYSYTYIKRASMENRKILTQKDEILTDKDYISLILARKKER